jgi:hypothetical protein
MKFGGYASLVLLAFLAFTPQANSAPCSNATLVGAYGSQDTQNGYDFHWFIVSLMKFDGNGHGTVQWEAWQRDDRTTNITPPPGFGFTYSVNPNCTFTLTHDNGLTFSGVIVKNGEELRYVETTGFEFRMGTAAKVNTENQQ